MKKLLIIEDELHIRETLADILTLHEYEVYEADTGTAGIEKTREIKPDVIICDINMPGENGHAVLKTLRDENLLDFTAFIFLTANSSMFDLREGMEEGADDYLTKPFYADSLLRTIHAAEGKKLKQLEKLNSLQNSLNEQSNKLNEIDQLSNHEIRRKLSLVQGLLPMIRSGAITLEKGYQILEDSSDSIDQDIQKLNELLHEEKMESEQRKVISIDDFQSIWLVDDDAIQNLLNKKILEKTLGHKAAISSYTSVDSATQALNLFMPDVLLLDLNMPGKGGFDFLDEINQTTEYADLKIIVLSSSVSPDDIYKAMSYKQVVNYLSKPLKSENIMAVFGQ